MHATSLLWSTDMKKEWLINCTKFAPNAPEQNLVEDIWLQTKNFSITFYHLCSSFKVVKLFEVFCGWSNIQFPKTFSVWNFVATYLGLLYSSPILFVANPTAF